MSDRSSKGRAGLATAEPGGNDQPLAKPIAATSLIQPASGVRPALRSESYVSFGPVAALDDFGTGLWTTGFEGVDEGSRIAQHVAPEKIAPIIKPLLEVRPLAAPITVYEPMEFIDYDDDDDTFGDFQPEAEPEPPPPPVLTEFLPVMLPTAAEPGRARLEPGFGTTPFADLSLEIPDLTIQALRKKLTYGPNPFAPKPEPVVEAMAESAPVSLPIPATAKPAPTKPASTKPAPSVVQRPAAASAAVKAEPAASSRSRQAQSRSAAPTASRTRSWQCCNCRGRDPGSPGARAEAEDGSDSETGASRARCRGFRCSNDRIAPGGTIRSFKDSDRSGGFRCARRRWLFHVLGE